jgi:aminopeptidase YwaD
MDCAMRSIRVSASAEYEGVMVSEVKHLGSGETVPNRARDVGMLLHRDLSGERAQALTAAITQFHRPPGASGYHAATNLVAAELRAAGLSEIEVTTYPLDGQTVAGEGPLPLAWEPHGAVVRIVSPVHDEVVNSETASSCLAWWSRPTPPGGMTAELVDLGAGERDEDYADKDLAGKIVLIGHTERPAGWMYAARRAMEAGAKGILSDYLFYTFAPDRTRESHPEAVQLLRLPNQRGQFDAWACGISYPAAQRLRDLLRLGPVTLHADIRCELFKGYGQNLLATIPGRELPEESVFFIAHCSAATCPCANCAAGPALMVEIARVLHDLIARGELRRPRRSVKFLFIIEGLGSRAFIQERRDELNHVKAAFCFDSVGHDQGKLKSVLLFYRHPDSSPSFINDYFAGVMERAPKDGTWVFADDTDIAPVQFTQAPYTPWSDNHIWAAYGVPSPLIMSWPDLHFHTQFLTADQTDPRVFRRAGVTTALAAYEIADAGADDALTIANEVGARAEFRLTEIANRAIHRIADAARVRDAEADPASVAARTRRELSYAAERDGWAIASVATLVAGQVPPRLEHEVAAHGDRLRDRATYLAARVEMAAAGGE